MAASGLEKSLKQKLGDKNTASVYQTLRAMAISFEFHPGERVNEGELAKELGISRTPVREALQQLVSEKFLRWERNKGFFCRVLNVQEVFDLYEYRQILEEHTTRLACKRAAEDELTALKAFVHEHCDADEESDLEALVTIDQQFHERIAELARNGALLEALKMVNQQIYFIRWVDMGGRRSTTQPQHAKIAEALLERNEDLAVSIMNTHVERRLEQISSCIREGYGLIYTGNIPKLLASHNS